MKKYLSIIALATLALVACSKVTLDQGAKNGEDTPISFQAYNYLSQTKADSHPHLEFPTDVEFDVWAYFHDGSYSTDGNPHFLYFNDVVAYSDNKWATKNSTYYWPKTGNLSFFAVAPAGKATMVDNGFKIENFEVEPVAKSQDADELDVMIAETYDQDCDADSEKHFYDGVGLIFKHQVAKVVFSGKLYNGKNYDSSSERIKVNQVFFSAVIDDISLSGHYYKGTFQNGTSGYAWAPDETATATASGTIVTMNYAPEKSTTFDYSSALPEADFKRFDEEYYVLPQTLSDDAIVTVEFTVYAMDSSGNVISKTSYTKGSTEFPAFTKKLNTFTGKDNASVAADMTNWKANTVYNYRFSIDPFEGQIYFDPCTEGWYDAYTAEDTPIYPESHS